MGTKLIIESQTAKLLLFGAVNAGFGTSVLFWDMSGALLGSPGMVVGWVNTVPDDNLFMQHAFQQGQLDHQ
ncbi:hypothetical protein [Rhodoferax ferrireducens]|uniref:hypothetical protein n=1 Tax=Rhodoferax ferrireducens TaxID=192843 RepID=UPI00140F5AF5|nr:hypothetical protein [Rhodoferax ferrireducens]